MQKVSFRYSVINLTLDLSIIITIASVGDASQAVSEFVQHMKKVQGQGEGLVVMS